MLLLTLTAVSIFLPKKASAATLSDASFKSPTATYNVTATYKASDGSSYYPSDLLLFISGVTPLTGQLFFNDSNTSDGTYQLKFNGNTYVCPGATIDVNKGSLQAIPNNGGTQWTGVLNLKYVTDSMANCSNGSSITLAPTTITLVDKSTSLCSDSSAPDANGKCSDGSVALPIANILNGTTPSCSNGFQNPPACDTCLNGTTITPCTSDSQTSPPPLAASATATTCEDAFSWLFEWIVCPALRMTSNAAGALNDFIEGQLCVNSGASTTGGATCTNTASIYGSNNPDSSQVHQAWDSFRKIATALLVILMLVMVIAQAFGGGPFEAYTVRKMLPKIVAAVILLQFSFVLTKFAIDISNDLGKGIQALLYAPFGGPGAMGLDKLVGHTLANQNQGLNDSALFFTALALGTGLAIGAISLPLIALLALYVLLALFTAFVVLVLRKLFIILLIVLAPIAFVLWILPGTEKYWKMWKDNFTKLLMMFPIIMALIAAGRIFALITSTSQTTALMPHLAVAHLGPLPVPYFSKVTTFIDLVIVLLAFFGPYYLLPKAFTWGGALMEMSGKGVKAGLDKVASPGKEYLNWRQGITPWKQARAARRAEIERRSKTGFYEGLASGGIRGGIRRARLGGVPRPTRGGIENERSLRGRIVQQAEAEIEKNRREEIQRATLQLMQRDLAQYHPDDHDRIRRAIISGETLNDVHLAHEDTVDPVTGAAIAGTHEFNGAEYAGTHDHGLRAALDRGVVHGHWRDIESYVRRTMASGDQERIAELQDFLQQNSAAIGDQMTHLLKGMNIAATSKPESIVKMRQEEIESVLGTLSSRVAGGGPGAAEAAGQLSVFLQNYATTAADGRLRTQLDQGGARAVKAFVANDPGMLDVINNDPAHGGLDARARLGLDTVDGTVALGLAAADPTTGTSMRDLHARISDTGVIR